MCPRVVDSLPYPKGAFLLPIHTHPKPLHLLRRRYSLMVITKSCLCHQLCDFGQITQTQPPPKVLASVVDPPVVLELGWATEKFPEPKFAGQWGEED